MKGEGLPPVWKTKATPYPNSYSPIEVLIMLDAIDYTDSAVRDSLDQEMEQMPTCTEELVRWATGYLDGHIAIGPTRTEDNFYLAGWRTGDSARQKDEWERTKLDLEQGAVAGRVFDMDAEEMKHLVYSEF
jgi:hypothetical protein